MHLKTYICTLCKCISTTFLDEQHEIWLPQTLTSTMINLWVHCIGFGWMHIYFQVGMIIGDTEQHNKICGFCGGNGLHRQNMSRDCNVTSDDADNPNIKCTRKEVKETCRLISWVMTTSEQNGNVMPSIPAHYEGKQSSKRRSKSTPAWWLVPSYIPESHYASFVWSWLWWQ